MWRVVVVLEQTGIRTNKEFPFLFFSCELAFSESKGVFSESEKKFPTLRKHTNSQ